MKSKPVTKKAIPIKAAAAHFGYTVANMKKIARWTPAELKEHLAVAKAELAILTRTAEAYRKLIEKYNIGAAA